MQRRMPHGETLLLYQIVRIFSVTGPDEFPQCADSLRGRQHDQLLCSAESRCDLTQQFLRANIHGATRREHLALLSGNRLATHGDGYLGTAAACCRNPECLAPSSREVVPDCSGQPTPASSSEDASRSTGSRNPDIHGGSFPPAVHSKHWPLAPARVFVELSARMPPTHRQ